MEFKTCSQCKKELLATVEFFHKGNSKYGLHSLCKKCRKSNSAEYYVSHVDEYKERWCRYYKDNRNAIIEKSMAYNKEYRKTEVGKESSRNSCKKYKQTEKGKAAIKRYDQSQKGRATQKRWSSSKSGKMASKKYDHSKKGKKVKLISNRKYQQSDKGKAVQKKARKKYFNTENGKKVIQRVSRKHYENNRISNCISRRIRASLGTDKDNNHWEDIVGYSLNQLKNHLENSFESGMSWNTYGKNGWHIDHKIPVSAFNIISYTCEDFKRCWALENLQPLWAMDNFRKGSKINYND